MTEITIDTVRCSGCGTCVDVCPYGIFSREEEETVPSIDPRRAPACSRCGHCGAVCPGAAITVAYPEGGEATAYPDQPPVMPGQLAALVKSRRSIRDYSDRSVPRETLERVFDIVRYAPTGMNRQPVHWLVVHDPAEVRRIAGCVVDWAREVAGTRPDHPLAPIIPMLIGAWESGSDLICHGAPHLVVAHAHEDEPSAFIDAIIAMTHLDLAAPVFGLGTCWAGLVQIAADASPDVAEELGLPPGHRPQCAMMIGYPKYRFRRIPARDGAKVTWR